ncbi:hypothetical protein ABHF33_07270 [Chitinibacter sp. FCG-7]|uniref:Uncharacterized protein n=1 Tax=Chitinibacter mangrovi TaxID=3153927 RepID=A0AAU7FDL0_9NEIS
MSIAVTGALPIGQWPEAVMVMVLFTIAELIEAKSLDRARNVQFWFDATHARSGQQYRQADGSWREAAAKSVAPQARVRIETG